MCCRSGPDDGEDAVEVETPEPDIPPTSKDAMQALQTIQQFFESSDVPQAQTEQLFTLLNKPYATIEQAAPYLGHQKKATDYFRPI